MIRLFFIIVIVLVPLNLQAENYSTYEGKIKSIYLHERSTNPYFGVVLEGLMDNNPCGTSRDRFIKDPNNLSDRHLSMLLAAHAAGKTVLIVNAEPSEISRCHNKYPTFDFIEIK